MRAPRVGLVLGGGGIAGYSFHAAGLGALHELTGWDPRTAEIVVGTSAGSSIASLLRGHVPIDDLLARILSVPTDPGGMARLRAIAGRGEADPAQFRIGFTSLEMTARELARLHRMRPFRLLSGLLPTGVVKTNVVGQNLAYLHGSNWPLEPLWITAVELGSGELMVFGRDDAAIPVSSAVEASCAIPGVFRPVPYRGKRYVDGSVHSATNADLLVDEGLDLVVVLSPMSHTSCQGIPSVAEAMRIIPSFHLQREVKALREAGTEVLVLQPDDAVVRAVGVNFMDPTRVVSVLVESSTSIFAALDDPDLHPMLSTLRDAAASITSPSDVPYPV